MSRKVTNPLTGHKIQVGGGTYNSLVRQGVISQRGGGELSEEQKTMLLQLVKSYVINTEYLLILSESTNQPNSADVIESEQQSYEYLKRLLLITFKISITDWNAMEDKIREGKNNSYLL